jgi:Mce-associated membrane protein
MSTMVSSDTDHDTDADTDAVETGKSSGRSSSRRTRFGFGDPLARSTTFLAIAVVLVVAALAAAVIFAVQWFGAPGGEDVDFSQQRDEVARVAENTIITLNTIDYRQIDKSFNDIVNTMTAEAQKDFTSHKDDWKSLLVKNKIVSTAKVAVDNGRKAIAVEDLNTHDGTASVMVVVNLTVTPDGQKPTNPRERYILHMNRTPDGWKTSSFDPVTVYPADQ